MDRDEISTLYRGPPIDASYQVSVHLAKRFQRGRVFKICILHFEYRYLFLSKSYLSFYSQKIFWKSTILKQELLVAAMFVN
jgi:hypothetical protein